jgi:hypothetical protein
MIINITNGDQAKISELVLFATLTTGLRMNTHS